jgi:arginyl-tRNA synthetase
LQYAHARATQIIEKSRAEASETDSYDENERGLLRKLSEYNEVVERASFEIMPHHICIYLYELAQEFNRFYEKSRIIGDDREAIRLGLVKLYRDTLAQGLHILGIASPGRL